MPRLVSWSRADPVVAVAVRVFPPDTVRRGRDELDDPQPSRLTASAPCGFHTLHVDLWWS